MQTKEKIIREELGISPDSIIEHELTGTGSKAFIMACMDTYCAHLATSNQTLLDEVNRLNGENERLRKQLSQVHTSHKGFNI